MYCVLCSEVSEKKCKKIFAGIKKDVSLHPLSPTNRKMYRRPVRLVGLGRKVFILEIRGSNPLRATKI